MSSPDPDPSGRTLMWEAKAADGRGPELLAWLLAATDSGNVFRSADRVVLVADLHGDAGTGTVPEPPVELLARPPHAWRFTRVR